MKAFFIFVALDTLIFPVICSQEYPDDWRQSPNHICLFIESTIHQDIANISDDVVSK
jgi:hypothetical protein